MAATKLVYILYRKPGMSREEFQRYWRDDHGPNVPAAGQTLGFHRYIQVHTKTTPMDPMWRIGRSQEEPPDGVAEVWWIYLEALQAVLDTPDGRAAMFATLLDEANFIDPVRSVIFLADEVDFPIPAAGS